MAGLLLGLWVILECSSSAALVITNVSVVNVTPSSFSVVWASSSAATPAISVFADANGTTNLSGIIGVEFYPLHTGDPALTNAYARRLDQALLRQKTINEGLVHVRISGCTPGTVYYFSLQATNANGQRAVWPATGPLPALTTARENSFVVQSRQLVFNLPASDASGSIVILSNSNTPSRLAAVAGDGVSSNQVYFSVSDLIASLGNTNYLPLGNQQFTASIFGTSSNAVAQTYGLNFTTDFLVGQESQVTLGSFAILSIGSAVLRAGDTATLPVALYASSITNLNLVLNLPAGRFSNVSVEGLSAQLGLASVQPGPSNSYLVTFAAAPGQTLAGNQQIAQLSLVTVSNQPSGFVPLVPRSLQAFNSDATSVANLAVRSGRLVIVAREPLLEALLGPGQIRSLALYGIPGASYEIQRSTNRPNRVGWNDLIRVPMTNLMEIFSPMDPSHPVVFYRAYQFFADPPLLEAHLAGQNRSLLVYGVPGTNYLVQYATNLSGVVAWYPLLNYTLTNSFQAITNLGNPKPVMFYRLQRP